MTQRLRGEHVSSAELHKAIDEFSSHGEADRWPKDHEAAGLPKDGYNLLNVDGYRRRCAARLVGLPTPPMSWDGVGTRHLAALAISWSLKDDLFLVLVRSDSGSIHALCP